MKKYPKVGYDITVCNDSRKCFARRRNSVCTILTETYQHDGECPFCKAKRSEDDDS